MEYHIKIMRSKDDEEKFFAKMGRFFASKDVRQELGGYPMNDSDKHLWLVALEKRKFTVIGFVGLEETGDGFLLHEAYVIPDLRDKNILDALIEKTIYYARNEGKDLRASVREEQVAIFKHHGFTVERKRGQWCTLRLTRKGK